MNAPLLAVLDETGTTNRPQLSTDSDFGVGVVVFDSVQRPHLVDAARRIGQEVGKRDFKYKHVQGSTSARKVFLDAINKLKGPSGVFGFFSPGMSLLNEKDRAVAEMAFLGSDDGGQTAEIAEQIRTGNSNVHLESFLGFFASCLNTYAGALQTKMDVHWDRRTDLPHLQGFCDDQRSWFLSHPNFGDASKLVSFSNDADGDLSSIARLAGVIAGDVRFFFQKHGNRIWPHLIDAKRLSGKPDDRLLEADRFTEEMTVATRNEPLADVNFADGSKETCMIQGYSKRFIAELMSFAAPNGVMGHLLIHHGSKWDIIQIPD